MKTYYGYVQTIGDKTSFRLDLSGKLNATKPKDAQLEAKTYQDKLNNGRDMKQCVMDGDVFYYVGVETEREASQWKSFKSFANRSIYDIKPTDVRKDELLKIIKQTDFSRFDVEQLEIIVADIEG